MYSRLLILLGIKITFDIVCYTSFNINFFFFNDTATTEIYTLSLHDALPILFGQRPAFRGRTWQGCEVGVMDRSEEHTSELQSLRHLVCRLLLEKKKKKIHKKMIYNIKAI